MRHSRSRGDEGQVLPALVVLVFAVLALSLAFFTVGRASNLRTEAQTAADAAALAGAKSLEGQLQGVAAAQLDAIVCGTGVPGLDLAVLDDGPAKAAAAEYASRNDAGVVGYQRNGTEVRVAVVSDDALGGSGAPPAVRGRRGQAEATASVTYKLLVSLPLDLCIPPPPPVVAPPAPGLPPPPPLPPPPLPEFTGTVEDILGFEVRLVA